MEIEGGSAAMRAVEAELAELESDAHYYAPRLFAIYGVYHHRPAGERERPPFLGWGMEFVVPAKAILWLPGNTTWHSDTAESIVEHYRRIADARLVWLDAEPDGCRDDYDLAGG